MTSLWLADVFLGLSTLLAAAVSIQNHLGKHYLEVVFGKTSMAIQVCGRTKHSVRIVRSIFDNVDLEETTPLISFRSAYAPTRSLARIQLDDQLFVDNRLHFFPGGNVRHAAGECVAVD